MQTFIRFLAATLCGGVLFLLACLGQLPSAGSTDRNQPAEQTAITLPGGPAPVQASTLAMDQARISTGLAHTCALTESGQVKCLGDNSYGQLGSGTHADSRVLADVQGLKDPVVAVRAGGYHTCALTTAGAVTCWGANEKGQLGNNLSYESTVPTAVSALPGGVKAISAGGSHTCALLADGTVRCWGDNAFGQLGNGTRTSSSTPVPVRNLKGVTAISAGAGHTCAIAATGVWCWGNNIMGQLGDGSRTDRTTPVQVAGLSDVKAIAAGGMHSCALAANGQVRCWGFNGHGQLGDGTTTDSLIPVTVKNLDAAQAVSAGGVHTCAVSGGQAYCWGFNRRGELGDGSNTDRSEPAPVSPPTSGITALSAGGAHTCALTASGIKCWGQNLYYQLGDGTAENSSAPVDLR